MNRLAATLMFRLNTKSLFIGQEIKSLKSSKGVVNQSYLKEY